MSTLCNRSAVDAPKNSEDWRCKILHLNWSIILASSEKSAFVFCRSNIGFLNSWRVLWRNVTLTSDVSLLKKFCKIQGGRFSKRKYASSGSQSSIICSSTVSKVSHRVGMYVLIELNSLYSIVHKIAWDYLSYQFDFWSGCQSSTQLVLCQLWDVLLPFMRRYAKYDQGNQLESDKFFALKDDKTHCFFLHP